MKIKKSKADKQLLEEMKVMKHKLHRRLGVKMCGELHYDCFDCKTRILISLLNSWIDLLKD